MGDETEFTKLPLEERCTHKLWKARVHGYTEAAKLFEESEEKAPVFGQYAGLVAKFVSDSNVAAQEKGLEAAIAFVQNTAPALAGKTVKDVMGAVVNKCIAAPRAKTKDLSVQVALLYIEVEKHEVVIEELIKGMEAKNPKIVAACIFALTSSLREFGSRVINVKPMMKTIGTLLEDRDKTVRDEAKTMVVEIFRWIGDAIRPQLASLKPIQVTELDAEFDKVRGAKAVPTRYLRSQQAQQAKQASHEDGSGDHAADVECEEQPQAVDPYDLMDPVNILSKMQKDFYEKLEAKKWQERKEALEGLEKILEYPKFEKGDYADLIRALMKVIVKDSNVVVVGLAVKCLGRLALGLKKMFQPYANTVLPQLLEKFKEKKANVVTPLREAVDAIYLNTSLEAIQEDLVALLDNKNPSIKTETASFLARCFARCTPAALNKKLMKVLVTALLKTLSESDPAVRDSAAEALGTAMKVVGEKGICPFMQDLDNLKMTKIKECCEKAVVVKQPAAKPASRPLPAKVEKPKSEPALSRAAPKAPAPKKVLSGGAIKKSSSGPVKQTKQVEKEREMGEEEVDEKAGELFEEDVIKGLVDAQWKARLEAMESLLTAVRAMDPKDAPSQVLVRVLCKKPGLKDSNFQVLKLKLEALKYIAENFPISATTVELVATDLADKMPDAKNGSLVSDVLLALADGTDLETVTMPLLDYAMTQKSPKLQQDAMTWTTDAIREFGLAVPTRYLVEVMKKGLNSTTQTVRTAAVTLAGTVYLYVGQHLATMIDDKPSVMTLVTAEFEKRAGEKPPSPTRGSKVMTESLTSEEGLIDGEEQEEKVEEKPLDTAVQRVDLSTKITDQLLAELGDKNWKVRNEALLTLSTLISETKSIKANLGELPAVLNQRLVDSNGKLAVLALEICKAIATAMGPPCRTHVKTFFRNFLAALGDSKAWVRTAALACINTWGSVAGYKEFFEGEVIPDMLKAGSPTLRTELWTLLSEILPTMKNLPKEEVTLCVPHLYASLEDRNSDVRKSAQSSVLGVMIHVGYSNMMKQTEKLKPGSKTVVVSLLEKTRPDLPVQAEPASKAKAKKDEEKPKLGGAKPAAKPAKATAAVKPYTKKKQEEVDTTPLLPINNMKNQRLIDEQKLKTLKWNFTLPRGEFVELLRELMTTAGLNKTLVANMFHVDFKNHLKAIESLSDDLDNVDALVANLDLILKWMTLRFFDTNPSVLLKGLEYLQNVFGLLIENGYTVFDFEANSFIPYLVLKIGDPKDAVRDRVRAILKQFSLMYSPGKLFILVIDGLKSKNARQRTECLDELGSLIEKFGMTVCQPNPAAALKEISKQISDRDNSVRSAALNAIVKAYFIEGDKIYKMIGQISEKDMSLLEERVKRSAKNRSNTTLMAKPEPKADREKSIELKASAASLPVDEEDEDMEPEASPPPPHRSGPSVAYSPHLYKDLDFKEPPVPKIDIIEIDDSFLDSPVKIPDYILSKMGKKPNPVVSRGENALDQFIRELGSPNISVAFHAATKLRVLLEGQDRSLLDAHTDAIMDSLVIQLKLVNSYSLESYGLMLPQTFRLLFRIIDDIFGRKTSMGSLVKVDHLHLLINELLHTLIEDKTAKFAEGGYNRWINVFVAKIIEEADHTKVTCAIIKLLFDLVANPPQNPKVAELSTKCMTKVILLLKSPDSGWWTGFDLDEVLYECHIFFQSYPRQVWRERPAPLPVKAVKTLLLTVVTLKGKDVFSHMTKIENPCATELAMYLRKLIKGQPSASKSSSSSRLSKAMSEHLSEIFMKIAYQETAKEGLVQLYEFKKQNPQLDLTSVLAPTSKYFQDYVESGLKDIEKEREPVKQEAKAVEPVAAGSPPAPPSPAGPGQWEEQFPNGKGLAQYYLDKLRAVQVRAGIHLTDLPDFDK